MQGHHANFNKWCLGHNQESTYVNLSIQIFVVWNEQMTKYYKLKEESSSTHIMQPLQTKHNIPRKYLTFR